MDLRTSVRVMAVSGRTGAMLWDSGLKANLVHAGTKATRDLTGDALPPVLAMQLVRGSGSESRDEVVLHALSGSTGQRVWTSSHPWKLDFLTHVEGDLLWIDDVDGDGQADVWAVAGSDMAIVSGRTGRRLWQQTWQNDTWEDFEELFASFAELDGVPGCDLVVCDPAGADRAELRGLRGRDGHVLWTYVVKFALSGWGDSQRPVRSSTLRAQPWTVVDLNGDQRQDVVIVDGARKVLVALDGERGEVLWQVPWSEWIGSSQGVRTARLGVPARAVLCVNGINFGSRRQLTVFDFEGRPLGLGSENPALRESLHAIQVFDGAQPSASQSQIVVAVTGTANQFRARAFTDNLQTVLWETPLPAVNPDLLSTTEWIGETEGVLTLAVRGASLDTGSGFSGTSGFSRFFGVDLKTGRLIWDFHVAETTATAAELQTRQGDLPCTLITGADEFLGVTVCRPVRDLRPLSTTQQAVPKQPGVSPRIAH